LRTLRRLFLVKVACSPLELDQEARACRCAIVVGDAVVKATLELSTVKRAPRRFVFATSEGAEGDGALFFPIGVSVLRTEEVYTFEPLRYACIALVDGAFEEAYSVLARTRRPPYEGKLRAAILSLLESAQERPLRKMEDLCKTVGISESGLRLRWRRVFGPGAPDPSEFLETLRFLSMLRLWLKRGSLKIAARHAHVSPPTARSYFMRYLGALPRDVQLVALPARICEVAGRLTRWIASDGPRAVPGA
jgi:hypothetical protein